MCGIAGMVTKLGRTVPEGLADRFAQRLAHRGPDGKGVFEAPGVLLVQARLAIIDLLTGDQPLHGPDGLVLVANGEVYNYRELRAELGEGVFLTRSDCEPPLHLYARRGLAGFDVLRGMYGIALWDPPRRRLVLCRDPFGIKPLYYVETNDGVAFASEPQALIGAGLLPAREDAAAVDELLQLQFTCGARTIFQGIRRVLPGETLVFEDAQLVERHRRPALPAVRERVSPADPLALLDHVLEDSLDLHQRADVPYGLFLSGGIDSSSVLAMMARLNERPVLAFTAGFPGTEVADERADARAATKAVGARHVEVAVSEGDFLEHLPAIAAAVDDPVADYAIVPTWLLAREAAKSVKVVLCGEGGDELLGGYGRYRGAMRPWPLARPLRRKGLLDGLGLLRASGRNWRAGIARAEAEARTQGGTRLIRAQRVDCADWLPHDLLNKLDRCLMAHGLEGRVPFVDVDVARFCLPLADGLKVRDGMGKWILRSWLERTLPEARPFAPKRGFSVPVGEWMSRHGDRLGPLVAASPAVAARCHGEAVRALFTHPRKETALAAWILLYYALWHRRHIVGLAPEGDVFHCLSTAA
ncbi:asparagine synthase (glutamine-hydrolyzing) [Rhodospirillum rubrum]|uniref:asparagine synthase (glutamine-hydrolyzing) n=1 Tax=Rhodospirillum rubrum TaxID=1085 RepID=UPI001908935D|nr:asparagine synthase (glutamine-hydrolyzing) [Rhodospirillum rubrum]MBK1666035.1 asparagine synthase (glutamine-hydrolyzing) [Rhodospirillum rubrum]MBK1678092.1 asparagine synthase (glutamine-hydrolyzing) [Rhodospirillum rubrum]